ncbi:uncharacterized protein RJT20DRAFT_51594 [Scheffersomyces xylosifermentans]|uniref:uncharacterized protein n=1 Tax=Scheffersomyces xylosifermentans TaxID=1304137 RepID=UPI00315C5BED
MNLIHLTVPEPITIWEDLVGCVLRQERFTDQMNEMDWLHSPLIKESLEESKGRYSSLFGMLTEADTNIPLVPTWDVDLIWHTHQLSMFYYFNDCLKSSLRSAVDHDDKVTKARLDDCFEKTAKQYEDKFKKDYSIFHCWYCVCIRNHSSNKLKGLFKSKSSSMGNQAMISNLQNVGLSHISTHNGIELPSEEATRKEYQVSKKYKLKTKVNQILLWNTFSITFSYYPAHFVIAPLSHITLFASQFYGDKLCCTVSDVPADSMGGCSSSHEGTNYKNNRVHDVRPPSPTRYYTDEVHRMI